MTDFPTPIEPNGLGATGAADPPIALRNALVDAVGRRRRRLRSRVALAGGICVAVAAAVLAGGAFTGGPERVLAIDNGSEWVTVRILDGDAGAAEMTQELQDAGIDAEVQALPARPDGVGRWLGLNLGSDAPRRPCDLPEDAPPGAKCPFLLGDVLFGGDHPALHQMFGDDAFQIRRDAVHLLGEMHSTFYVGREPEPGEHPVDPPAVTGPALRFYYTPDSAP